MKNILAFIGIILVAQVAFATQVNLRTPLVSDVSGFPAVNFDLDLGKAWTVGLGAGIAIFSFGGTSPTASEFNLNAMKYFSNTSFSDSWFLGPVFEVTNGSIHTLGLTENQPTAAFGGRTGYQWMWSAFNIQLGALVLSSPSYLTVGVDFTIGWLIN
jgi:hypothetical protein